MPSPENTKKCGSNNSLGMIGGEIAIDTNSQEYKPDSPTLNRRNSIKDLLKIGSISEYRGVLLDEDDYDDDSSCLASDEESSVISYHGSASVAASVDRIKQNLVGGFTKIVRVEYMNANGNKVVGTSNQPVKIPTKVILPSTSDSSIESSLASQSYNGSCASLTNSVVLRHKKTLNAFKKMDSRNHMAKEGRVVKSCQEKRSSLMGDELMDRFLKKRAANASRKSSVIKKNDSFKKMSVVQGKFPIG